jgi:pimeloyl-ACP methyl ester carboxylesterase
MAIQPRRGSFRKAGRRLGYTDYDGGGSPLVLMPGLLLSREMHHPLATALAERGHRVITFDPLGHGSSDRPRDMWRYSITLFADDCRALLDHLHLPRSVVGGTSLGANVTLELASHAPERLSGMLIEMPVLDNGLLACALSFTPLLAGLTLGEPAFRVLARGLRGVPRRLLPFYANVALDALRQEPGPSSAILQGLFFGRTAPHRDERRTFTAPTLVLGHRRDPIHPFSDADMLAHELANARLVEANSLLELRFSPDRLTDEIHRFLLECAGATTGARRTRGPRSRAEPSRVIAMARQAR